MLPARRAGTRGPLFLFLHWLGGGAQSWDSVCSRLSERGFRCVALDLPGFGDAAGTAGYDCRAMADAVAETISELREGVSEPWLLAGHSMGGKVAALLARRALDGEAGLGGLAGLLLVSPSPPAPEPMPGHKRDDLLKALGAANGDASDERRAALKFVDANTGKASLPAEVREHAVEGVLSMQRTAFRAWLTGGSLEDGADRVGTLNLPALLLAGSEDAALGVEAQEHLTLPHLPEAEWVTLSGIGHLAPLECPGDVAERAATFAAGLGLHLPVQTAAPGEAFRTLLASDRTSPATREAMQARLDAAQSWSQRPGCFTADEFRTLRALAECVLPGAGFDLAAAAARRLEAGPGDGWRFANLPVDVDAWRLGLRSLEAAAMRTYSIGFTGLDEARAGALLEQAAEGKLGRGLLGAINLGGSAQAYAAAEMKSWFEEVRGEFAKLYMGDPRTMDRIRYTGFADDLAGFTQIRLGEREDFER